MTKQTFFIKANSQLIYLLQDISLFAKDITQRKKLPPTWLCFAKRKAYGYSFLHRKKVPFHLLEEIVRKTSAKHPHITPSRIVDMLSELANTTVKDAILLNGLPVRVQESHDEKKYVATPLIYLADARQYIPRHPWFVHMSNSESDFWYAKDITNGEKFSVSKKQQGDFYEFEMNLRKVD